MFLIDRNKWRRPPLVPLALRDGAFGGISVPRVVMMSLTAEQMWDCMAQSTYAVPAGFDFDPIHGYSHPSTPTDIAWVTPRGPVGNVNLAGYTIIAIASHYRGNGWSNQVTQHMISLTGSYMADDYITLGFNQYQPDGYCQVTNFCKYDGTGAFFNFGATSGAWTEQYVISFGCPSTPGGAGADVLRRISQSSLSSGNFGRNWVTQWDTSGKVNQAAYSSNSYNVCRLRAGYDNAGGQQSRSWLAGAIWLQGNALVPLETLEAFSWEPWSFFVEPSTRVYFLPETVAVSNAVRRTHPQQHLLIR